MRLRLFDSRRQRLRSCHDEDVASILGAGGSGLGVKSGDISAVIWSHNYFDHIGDPSTIPSSTELVVSPVSWPGYPRDPEAGVAASLFSFSANIIIGGVCRNKLAI